MRNICKNIIRAFCAFTLVFVVTVTGSAREESEVLLIPAGQKMNIEGVILSVDNETLMVRTFGNAVYEIFVSNSTELRERRSNFLRGARRYSAADLIPGLQVEARGIGMNSGALSASEVRFRHDDYIVAQAMNTRVIPVETDLRDTQVRLGETERNADRLSGQIMELSAITDLVHSDAKAAQTTADAAVALADSAHAGVQATNERITLIDDFETKALTTIHFNVGSSALTAEYRAQLDAFAHHVTNERGYLIEVAGFASSDGNPEANRRLSRQRADAVIQYLAENYRIPLRRFAAPMGYGESHPVGDNSTRTGREENRRVEVRLLVNKGLISD